MGRCAALRYGLEQVGHVQGLHPDFVVDRHAEVERRRRSSSWYGTATVIVQGPCALGRGVRTPIFGAGRERRSMGVGAGPARVRRGRGEVSDEGEGGGGGDQQEGDQQEAVGGEASGGDGDAGRGAAFPPQQGRQGRPDGDQGVSPTGAMQQGIECFRGEFGFDAPGSRLYFSDSAEALRHASAAGRQDDPGTVFVDEGTSSQQSARAYCAVAAEARALAELAMPVAIHEAMATAPQAAKRMLALPPAPGDRPSITRREAPTPAAANH